MIVFDLACAHGHRFEGWFGSSEDYDEQSYLRLVQCPVCNSVDVAKAPMAPAVPKKGNQRVEQAPAKQAMTNGTLPPEVAEALGKLAEAQVRALKDSTWVGDDFADRSRAMHYGERATETIHGRATPGEAKALLEEGVPVAPLPFPVAAPSDLN